MQRRAGPVIQNTSMAYVVQAVQYPGMQVCSCGVLTSGGKQNEAVWGEGN